MLDLVASEKLRTPSAWEMAQWRAAKRMQPSARRRDDVAGWERCFDLLRGCYHRDGALEVLEPELRRRDEIRWAGAAPAVAASAACPAELTRSTYFLRISLFSFLRTDYYTPNGAGTLVDAFPDYVLAPGAGGASGNALSIDPTHRFLQGTDANKVALPSADANFGGRTAATFDGTNDRYDSTLSPGAWRFGHISQSTFAVARRAALGTHVICASTHFSGVAGYDLLGLSSGQVSVDLYSSSTAVLVPNLTVAGGFPANSTRFVTFEFDVGNTPDASLRSSPGNLSGTLDASAATSATDPVGMRVGSRSNGALFYAGQIADIMWLTGTNAVVRTAAARNAFLRYGIVA